MATFEKLVSRAICGPQLAKSILACAQTWEPSRSVLSLLNHHLNKTCRQVTYTERDSRLLSLNPSFVLLLEYKPALPHQRGVHYNLWFGALNLGTL